MINTQSAGGPSRGGAMLMSWGPTVLFSIVLPWVTYGMLTDHGVGQVPALLIISGWPVVEMVLYFAIHRRLDEFSIMILGTLLLSAVSALAYNSTKMVFIKDSALTGLLGLAFLVSLFAKRPLNFYFGRKFATDGTAESVATWNGLWDKYAGFRSTQRMLTVVWGVTFLVESGIRIALTYVLSTDTMVGVSSVMPFVFTAGLVFYTIRTGRKGEARRGTAEAAEAAGAAEAESAPPAAPVAPVAPAEA
ncbi:VC0807 family protein [Streptomyces sp. H10-C2]|uniref:VC0807 family protein n=1 Tax=unclassified Streptomyces TaxID=2593676 RepID=UPI0024B969AD|nr:MULTISPECIES: VC0807 family protein [unclassified Streptomyces]MDJ0342349.1 VC0807 family protein [Streptomyces sp. PH10-H1]MDJ0372204.1 VC0807 family protein [Streptomyces sp. H10-C2]